MDYLALHVDANYLPSTDGWHLSGHFKGWQGVFWKDGDRGKWASGESSGDMWEWLRRCASDSTERFLTVWGWKIWPLWCVSDGMKEVDEDRLILDVSGDKPKGLFIAADPPTIIKLEVPGRGGLRFIDLANYGIEPEHYGVNGSNGVLAATRQAVIDYHKLCRDWEMGMPATTAASQAWQTYRMHHQPIPPAQPPISGGSSILEEAAYFGGRCECRRLGEFKEQLWHLDVSSMYTAIGLTAQFPRAYTGCRNKTHNAELPPQEPSGNLVIADVTVTTDRARYPASDIVRVNHLQEPGSVDGIRIIYPIGTFRTALCGPELAIAIGFGHIVDWHRIQYYEPSPLMAMWSKWALAMRNSVKHGDTPRLSKCAKKIINSLPGKWCQRTKNWMDCPKSHDPSETWQQSASTWGMEYGEHPYTDQMTQYRTIAGKTQYLASETLSPESCPAVAAYWTSYGRVMLATLMYLADWDNVYYYDTDSLIVNDAGFAELCRNRAVADDEPGKLRIIESAKDTKILGIRNYFMGGKWHVAGSIPDVAVHEGFNWQMWKHRVGRPVESVSNESIAPVYKHGVVRDGRVSPFVVGK